MQLPSHTDPSLCSKASAAGSLPQSAVPSFGLIDEELGQVKRLIDEQLFEDPESGGRLLRSVNICSDKMIRPGLVLLSYRAVLDDSCANGLTAKRTDSAKKNPKLRKSAAFCDSAENEKPRNTRNDAVRIAAIVELIHSATLLHGDVMEGGQKRRGLPTVNILWGTETAVLLGDFLLGKAFKICADLDPEIADIIARMAVRICEGALREVTERQNWQLSESEYIDIITEKSATLFSSCCLLGGHLAGAGETQIRSLADFGLNIGIAFQITDDLLDLTGDGGKTDKTPGIDFDNNKLTLAVIHLLRAIDEREKNSVINSYLENPVGSSMTNNSMTAKGEIPDRLDCEACLERDVKCRKEGLAEMLGRLGSMEYAYSRAQEFVTKALDALTDLNEGKAKDALVETAKYIGRRAI
jgi:geranylgeranyl pyrophosphate synthase